MQTHEYSSSGDRNLGAKSQEERGINRWDGGQEPRREGKGKKSGGRPSPTQIEEVRGGKH